jgi:hemoglobin-like flavoprotein
MDSNQIAIVQKTFERVEEQELEPSRIFYEELFAASPHLRPLFSSDMSKQYRMFIMAVAYCVGALQQPEAIQERLEQLAIRHVGYGALPEHYAVVGRALMRMLAKVLEEDFTPDAVEAWSAAYAHLSGVMLAAAAHHRMPARKAS